MLKAAIVVGYFSAIIGIYLLFTGIVYAGGLLFFVGGLLCQGLAFNVKSIALTSFIVSLSYGLHIEFNSWIIFILLASLLIFLPTRGKGKWDSWLEDKLDLIDISPGNDSGFGGGGFGDGGSCGGGGD